jgi:hypothetical protein
MSDDPRVETGVIKLGDDWPGVFIRGDDACAYATHLEVILRRVPRASAEISVDVVRGLIDLLKLSNQKESV